jgi:hypothetical protein
MNGKNLVLAGVVLVCMIFVMFMMNQRKRDMADIIQEIETGVPVWDGKKAEVAHADADAAWKRASEAMAAHDLAEIFLAYRGAHSAVSVYAEGYPDEELEPGLTYKAWMDQKEEEFRPAMRAEFGTVLAMLETGDMAWPEVRQLVTNFSTTQFKDLEALLDERKGEIIAKRTRGATKWFRVSVRGNTQEYGDLVEQAVRAVWGDGPGYKLVFGYAMDNAERDATWKTLDVSIEQEAVAYHAADNTNPNVWVPAIPYQATIAFGLKGSESVPTSWDKLEPVQAQVDVPDSLHVELERFGGGVTAAEEQRLRELEKGNLTALRESLKEKLQGMAAFKLFPGVDLTAAQVLRGDRIDIEAARALSHLDKARFQSEFDFIRNADDIEGMGGLVAIIIGAEMDTYAAWVSERIVDLDRASRDAAFAELVKRPWYGDYGPVLALVRGEGDNLSSKILSALRGHMHVQNVQQAFLERIDDPEYRRRGDMVGFLLREAPLDDLGDRVTDWIADADEHVSGNAYTALASRDKALALKVAVENFDGLSERLKSRVLGDLNVTDGEEGEANLVLVTDLLKSEVSRELRQSVVDRLFRSAYTPHGWDALMELAISEPEPKMKRRIRQKLIMEVERAHPDQAEGYLLQQLPMEDTEVRRAAMLALLSGKTPKNNVVAILADLIAAEPGNPELVEVTVSSIHQYHKIRKGWDFAADQPEMAAILEKGAGHETPQVREFAYTVMGFALKQGNTHCREMLETALGREMDQKLQEKIRLFLQ